MRTLPVLALVMVTLCGCGPDSTEASPPGPPSPADTSTSPGPETRPRPQPDPHEIVADPKAEVTLADPVPDGTLLAVYSRGERQPTAIAVRRADGTVHVRLGPPGLFVRETLGRGWLGGVARHGAVVVDPSGRVSGVERSGRTVSVRPHDVTTGGSSDRVYRPRTDTIYRSAGGPRRLSYPQRMVEPDGTLLAVGGTPTRQRPRRQVLAGTLEEDGWRLTELDRGFVDAAGLAVNGEHVLVPITRDPAPRLDGAPDPVHRFALSSDGGRTWRFTTSPADLVESSVGLTRSGIGLVIGLDALSGGFDGGFEPAVRVRADGATDVIEAPVGEPLTDGRRFYVLRTFRDHSHLYVSSDAGDSWRRLALPGRE